MHGSANIELLELAARHLEEIVQEVAFVGGATVVLMMTDEAAPDVRPTIDVDVIVEIGNQGDYYALAQRLREKGFSEDDSDGAPLCRFRGHGLTLDVMPTDPDILGFSNRWYAEALAQAERVTLPSGAQISVVSALHFIATKLEAFAGRGGGDYMSHDLEDIVAVVDGRPEIVEELAAHASDMTAYIREAIRTLVEDQDFLDALPGFLPGDRASQERRPMLENRLRDIAGEFLNGPG